MNNLFGVTSGHSDIHHLWPGWVENPHSSGNTAARARTAAGGRHLTTLNVDRQLEKPYLESVPSSQFGDSGHTENANISNRCTETNDPNETFTSNWSAVVYTFYMEAKLSASILTYINRPSPPK